jgi:hypothetical protein
MQSHWELLKGIAVQTQERVVMHFLPIHRLTVAVATAITTVALHAVALVGLTFFLL